MLIRRIQRLGRTFALSRPLDPRALLFFLLWGVGLLVPPLHVLFEEQIGGAAQQIAVQEHRAHCVMARAHGGPAVESCAGGDCSDPRHHHHRPLAHADPADCPICSTQPARVADVPTLLVYVAPATVKFVEPHVAALRPVASRRVISLARGPPSPPLAG